MVAVPHILTEIYGIFHQAPTYTIYLEALLFFSVIWLIFYNRNGRISKISPEQKQAIIDQWTPEPLVADTDENDPALRYHLVTGRVGKRITVDGKSCLNLASQNYLGLLENEEMIDNAIRTIRKYGVGSCGPRGFYGTVDIHLELEERLAKFMEMEEAVVYSYAFSTIASAIPAYSKRNDIIFVDEAVNFAIQKGLDAARSTVVFFRHNDVKDLEAKLEQQAEADRRNPKKAAKTRKFLIAEGIYQNTGEICPLRELVELRKRFKLRMFLDESISFGTLGAHGRGLTEYLGVDRREVDLISASLEIAIGSIGGFCVGSHFIVEHQRLSGLGYCFSASLPPLLAQAAITALDTFEGQPVMFEELQQCAQRVHRMLERLSRFKVQGDPISPVKHLHLMSGAKADQQRLLRAFSDECIKEGLAVIAAEYLDQIEKNPVTPSIRIAVNRLLSVADIEEAFMTLEDVSKRLIPA